jgi:hypothetical protein
LKLLINIVLIGALVLPALWVAWRSHTVAMGDVALIELRTRDVLSSHPPLLGAYSRYGWAHPGPAAFWLLAVPYRVLGGDGDAMRLGALAVNVVAMVAMVWVARCRGTAAQFALLGALTLLTWGLGLGMLIDSWNATMAVLPLMLTVVACWCAWCGDKWAWVVAAVSASFTFQTHAGFGIVVAPLLATTLVVLALRVRNPGSEFTKREFGIGIGAGLLTATAVMIESIVHWPGNLTTLVRWSTSNDEPTVGLVDSLRFVGRTSSLSFVRHAGFPNQFVLGYTAIATGFLPGVLLVLLAAAAIVAARRRMRAEALLCGCLGITWISGVLACASITEPVGYWLIWWLQPLAWLTWACVAL